MSFFQGEPSSPSGWLLVSASEDASLRYWDPVSGKLLRTFWAFHNDLVEILPLPDGNQLLLKVAGEPFQIWDVTAGRAVNELSPELRSVLAIHPDGKLVATKLKGMLTIGDMFNVQSQYTFGNYMEFGDAISFSPDGRSLAVVGPSIFFSGNLYSTGEDDHFSSDVFIWSPATGEQIAQLPIINPEQIVYSPSGRLLAVSSNETDSIMIWDIQTFELVATLDNAESGVLAFSPDEHQLAAGSGDIVQLWDISEPRLLHTLYCRAALLLNIHFSNDGETVSTVSSTREGTYWTESWLASTGELLSFSSQMGDANQTDIYGLVVGQKLVLANRGSDSVELWNTVSGQLEYSYQISEYYVELLAISTSGKLAVTDYEDLSLVDLNSGQLIARMKIKNGITAAAFNPDGTSLAVIYQNYSIEVFDVSQEALTAAGNPIDLPSTMPTSRPTVTPLPPLPTVLPGSTPTVSPSALTSENLSSILLLTEFAYGTVEDAAWIPGDHTIAVAGSLGIVLYDAQTMEPIANLETGETMVSLAISQNGRILAGMSERGVVQIWDLTSLQLLGQIETGEQRALSVAISPNGLRVAYSQGYYVIQVWDRMSERTTANLNGFATGNLRFNADGRQAAVGHPDGLVRIFDTSTGRVTGALGGPLGRILHLAYSPDGLSLAASVSSGDVWLWDLETSQPLWQTRILHSEEPTFYDPTGSITCIAFRADGAMLAVGAGDGSLRLIDAVTGQVLVRQAGNPNSIVNVDFSSDGDSLLSLDSDNRMIVWDVVGTRLVQRSVMMGGGMDGLGFQPENRITVWQSGAIWQQTAEGGSEFVRTGVYTGTVLAVSHDGNLAAVDNGDEDERHMELWQMGGTAPIVELPGDLPLVLLSGVDLANIYSAAFSPDDTMLAAGATHTLWVWDLSSNSLIYDLGEEYYDSGFNGFGQVRFSPDGSLLAAYSTAAGVVVWDIKTGQLLRTFPVNDEVSDFVFSPDGKRIAALHWAYMDDRSHSLSVWDLSSGQEVLWMPLAESDYGYSLAYSPDGDLLALGTSSGQIVLFDAHTFQRLLDLDAHDGGIADLIFSPDGRFLTCVGGDGRLTVWGLPPEGNASSEP